MFKFKSSAHQFVSIMEVIVLLGRRKCSEISLLGFFLILSVCQLFIVQKMITFWFQAVLRIFREKSLPNKICNLNHVPAGCILS